MLEEVGIVSLICAILAHTPFETRNIIGCMLYEASLLIDFCFLFFANNSRNSLFIYIFISSFDGCFFKLTVIHVSKLYLNFPLL